MRLKPTITFEQYSATHAAVMAAKPKRGHKRSWQEYALLVFVCLMFGLAPQSPATRIPALTIFAVLVLCWIFQKPLARRSQEKCLKRFYDEEQAKLNDQVLTVNEAGISCDQSNGNAVSHQTWQAFINSIDLPDAFLFLPSPNTFIRVPKETLTPSECDMIREWSAAIPRSGAVNSN